MAGGEEYTDWIYSQITILNQSLINSWEYLSSNNENLNSLPANLQHSLNEFMDKLSLNGSLPTLNNLDWKLLHPTGPPPIPTPPPSSGLKLLLNKLNNSIQSHPYLISILLTSTGLGTTYYLFPKSFNHHSAILFKPLRPFIPLSLLPTSDRPKRIMNSGSMSSSSSSINGGNEIRKEVVLILGADSLIGREIALDLEKKGFVVICSVKLASEVEVLEKKSKGWMKVLVLDPTESSTVSPFLRSLSTALSLRYPLNSSGDPFARPSHAIALTSVINCLSILTELEPLCPIEGMNFENLSKIIGERCAVLVGVLKGILPIMRTMANRPNAPEGVIVNLIPANTANFSLPFLSISSAVDSAIISILNSLRRELNCSNTINLRSTILEVGFFETSTSSSPSPTTTTSNPTLSNRLLQIYPSLSHPSTLTTTLRKPTPIKSLLHSIHSILIYSRGGNLSRVGNGSFTYWFLGNFTPIWFVDSVLILGDGLNRGLRRLGLSNEISTATLEAEATPSSTTPRASSSAAGGVKNENPFLFEEINPSSSTTIPTSNFESTSTSSIGSSPSIIGDLVSEDSENDNENESSEEEEDNQSNNSSLNTHSFISQSQSHTGSQSGFGSGSRSELLGSSFVIGSETSWREGEVGGD